MEKPLSIFVPRGKQVTAAQIAELTAQICAPADYRDKKILLIVPDATRTAPVGLLFKTLHAQLGHMTRAMDVLVALGTHQPMSEEAICQRLEISLIERQTQYRRVTFFNHEWQNPQMLKEIGTIRAEEIAKLSGGLFAVDVPVRINRLIYDYDQIIIIGPVFPHEVVGFSGGNKYLFPGISGPEVLNFFHWLGAVITSPMVIGQQWTPVRAVVDRAAAMVHVPKLCFCMVVDGHDLAGVCAGSPESAWNAACSLSNDRNITYKEKPFHLILSCAPLMYNELWTGAKCMYKLEPVLADGGELIIYAPHIEEVCFTHKQIIEKIGYHCRDYFLKQWDEFKHYPWGVLAHSTHVYGAGTYKNGVESSRVRVTLATKIPRDLCQRINLGYRDPASIRIEDYARREEEGILLAPNAGEKLYRIGSPGTGLP